MMMRHGLVSMVVCVLALGCLLAETPPLWAPPPITITPSDGFNLAVEDQPDDHYVVVKLTSPAHNWFAGAFTNLPTDAPTTIGLNMAGNDTKGNKADVGKWKGLVPVMTYADPTKYESYECFSKGEDGMWRSTDVLKPEKEREAGTGTCPKQSAIPEDLAEEFLSKDGKSWEPWREVEEAEAVTQHNVFRITHHFKQATATVAMRVPYTYTYQQQLIERLQAAKLPGVFVDEIGMTVEGRKLQVVRVEDHTKPKEVGTVPVVEGDICRRMIRFTVSPVADAAAHPIHLLFAREHATEQTGSWVVIGALLELLNDSTGMLRSKGTWMFAPIQYPDCAAASQFDTLTSRFRYQFGRDPIYGSYTPIEVIAYARYLAAFANAGYSIASSTTWYSPECGEGANVTSPFAMERDLATTTAINYAFMDALRALAIAPGSPIAGEQGLVTDRLHGWCLGKFGSLALAYEINDRYPSCRLSLGMQQRVGAVYTTVLSGFCQSPAGLQRLAEARDFVAARALRRAEYISKKEALGGQPYPNVLELLDLGY